MKRFFLPAFLLLLCGMIAVPQVIRAQSDESNKQDSASEPATSAVETPPSSPGSTSAGEPAASEAANVDEAKTTPVKPSDKKLNYYVVALRTDGSLVGTVNKIDSQKLSVVRVPNADVMFIRNAKVVRTAKSDSEGRYTVNGLSPQSIYSVIAKTDNWMSTFTVAVVKDAQKPQIQDSSAQKKRSLNPFRTTSLIQEEAAAPAVANSGGPAGVVSDGAVAATTSTENAAIQGTPCNCLDVTLTPGQDLTCCGATPCSGSGSVIGQPGGIGGYGPFGQGYGPGGMGYGYGGYGGMGYGGGYGGMGGGYGGGGMGGGFGGGGLGGGGGGLGGGLLGPALGIGAGVAAGAAIANRNNDNRASPF